MILHYEVQIHSPFLIFYYQKKPGQIKSIKAMRDRILKQIAFTTYHDLKSKRDYLTIESLIPHCE